MDKELMNDREPVHGMFGLTYANYLVLPRSALQSAPVEWQRRFVGCVYELEDMFGQIPEEGLYYVYLRDARGRFVKDPYKDYERGRRVIKMVNPPPKPKKELVQVLNPKTKRYVLIDKSMGKILKHSRTSKPYKNIPIMEK